MELKGDEKKKYAIKQYDSDRKELDDKWKKIDNMLKDSNADYVAPKIPFHSDALICDYNELYKKIYDKEKFVNL